MWLHMYMSELETNYGNQNIFIFAAINFQDLPMLRLIFTFLWLVSLAIMEAVNFHGDFFFSQKYLFQ